MQSFSKYTFIWHYCSLEFSASEILIFKA